MGAVRAVLASSTSSCLLATCLLLCCFGSAAGRSLRRQDTIPARQLTQDGTDPQNLRARTSEMLDDFQAAPACLGAPNATNSIPDTTARLWGFVQNTSCAYKDHAGHVVWYPEYIPGDWLLTPACSMPPFPPNSVVDGGLMAWGWEADGSLCSFKDDQQQPFPINMAYMTTKLSFQEAAACTNDPVPTRSNSRPDKLGCLWGFQVHRNCAFKNDTTQEPLYYGGYKLVCNVTASIVRASDFNMDPDKGMAQDYEARFQAAEGSSQGDVPVHDMPDTTTKMPHAGQKESQHEASIKAAESLDFSQAPWMENANQMQTPAVAVVMAAEQRNRPQEENTQTFGQATFFTDDAKSDITSRSPGNSNRQLLGDVEVDPNFPKGAPFPQAEDDVQGCSDGNFPGHKSASESAGGPCLPEGALTARARKLSIASEKNTATHAPVQLSFRIEDLTLPDKAGGKAGRRARARAIGVIKASSDPSDSSVVGVALSIGHKFDPMNGGQRRRLLDDSITVATSKSNSNSKEAGDHHRSHATAQAVSSGNSSAMAISNAGSNGTANSEAVARDRHVTVALANVNKGNCILSVSVHNKKVTWHCAEPASQPSASDAADALPSPGINTPAEQHATFPSTTGDATGLANLWLKASSCNHAPDLTNSIPDPEGRLWGEEQEKPCAYRADNNTPVLYQGFLPLKFETTPACSSLPTATNSMPDAQNRLFGWDQSQQEYCAFKDASIGQPVFASSPFTAPPNAPEDAGPELAPSAAGPSSNVTQDNNGTTPAVAKSDKPADAAPSDTVLQSAADTQAEAITNSLTNNATSEEVALATAKAAIIYQMASEATTPQPDATNTVRISEGSNNIKNEQLPPLILDLVKQLRLRLRHGVDDKQSH